MKHIDILNSAALAVLLLATLTEQYWVWGVLFLFWAFRSYRTGSVFLLSPIFRKEAPILFWMVLIFWAVLGAWYLLPQIYW